MADDTRDVIEVLTHDHREVEDIRTLKELESVEATDPEFTTLTRRLIDEVTEHVRDEESSLFARFIENTAPEELLKLGEKVQNAKRVAPTRPHPAAPDHPPLNKLLAPGTGLIDRVRDRLSGRGGS
jgi:hypothetical protein